MKIFIITIISIIALVGCGGAEERKSAYLEKARLSLDAGDLDKARIELKNVLQIDPNNSQAYFLLGKTFDQKKEYAKAYAKFSKAVQLDPDNLEAQSIIGRYYIVLGRDIKKASEVRDLILSKDQASIYGLMLKAAILSLQGDASAAKKISTDIFDQQSDYLQNVLFLSALHINESDYKSAINILEISRKKNSSNGTVMKLLANTYFKAEMFEQAENIYKTIVQNSPDVFSNYIDLATFYKNINKIDEAEQVLRNAEKENPEALNIKLALVNFVRETRGIQKAIDEMLTLISDNPTMGDLSLTLGALYVASSKLDEAEKTFKSTASNFPDDSIGIRAMVYLSTLYIQKGDIDLAINVIEEAILVSPNDSDVNLLKAKVLLHKNDFENAIISLRIVTKANPEKIEAFILLAEAHSALNEHERSTDILNQAFDDNRNNAKQLIQLALYYSKKSNNEKLERTVDAYMILDSNNYQILSFKCALLNNKKLFTEVKPYAKRLIELYPEKPSGYVESVPFMLLENGNKDIITFLEDSYKKVGDSDRILELLVSFESSQKRFDSAKSRIQDAMDKNGETSKYFMLLAKVQLASSAENEAITSLNKVLEINSESDQPYLLLAHIYIKVKKNSNAISVLQQGIGDAKNILKLSFELAKIHESMGNYDQAINVYENAYVKYNNNALLINNLAALLSEHRFDEKSLNYAKELADRIKNVDQIVMLDTVGWVYYKVGDYQEAVNILKEVVNGSPEEAIFNYHLGMALYKAGFEAEAKIHLSKSLSGTAVFSGMDVAKSVLQKIK